jgi:cytidylate kinase
MNWQIAIDGPAGAGKSTISKKVAEILGFEYIDTGAMYRAVTLKALNLKINMYEEKEYKFLEETKIDFKNQHVFLDDVDVSDEIRSLEVSNNVSLVASFNYVRHKLVLLQQELASSKNVIMDGRDIGTVVLPNANLKIFLNAEIEERAKRRMNERLEKKQDVQNLATTIKEIQERDEKDSNRPISPLAKAEDAIEIDTSKLNVDEVVEEIIKLVLKRGYKMENLEQKNTNLEATENEAAKTEVEATEVKAPAKRGRKKKTEEAVPVAAETVEAPVEEEAPVADSVEEVAPAEVPQEAVQEAAEQIVEGLPEVEASALEDEDDVADEESEEEGQNENKTKYRELQVVEGTVVEVIEARPEAKVGNRVLKAKEERVLIRLDDGQEGYLFRKDTVDIKEDEDLFDLFIEGDRVQVVIKKIYPDGGKFVFSTVLLKMRHDLKQFDEIIKNHGTFKAKVVKALSVGYLLKHGEFSCLLPTSQVSATEEELANFIGSEIDVAPIRIDYGRIRLIVSQSVATAIKKRHEKRAFLDTVEVGQVFEGTVKNIESYGAFVEIADGVEGLLHISELDHNRVYKVEKVLKPGDKVTVKVIKIDKEHVGLSRKALIPNFWQEYVADKEVGSVVQGQVTEINNSGVVLQLAAEVSGFLPKSEFAYERDVFITDTVNVGDNIDVKIIEIDPHKKRIILSRKQLTENPWDTLHVKVNDTVEVVVTKELKDGYKVSLNGASGYLPKGSIYNYNEPINEGDTLKARVRVFDPQRTRLVVNLRAEVERQERETYGKYMKNQEKLSNTFGDMLEDQLKGFRK